MSVVQRCPNCGTTQSTAGECQACHEAQVRYFCTNHEPGIWLAGRTCPQCEARAAAPARKPASTSTPAALEPRPVDEAALDRRPARPPFWAKLLRAAILARRSSPRMEAAATERPDSRGPAGGFLRRLVLRLGVVALVMIVGLAVAVYMVVHSLR